MNFLNNGNLQALMIIFENEGYEIRVVGGAVRDFLNNTVCKDIDLCTDATPDEMMAVAKKHNLHVIPTGIKHGTITFMINHEPFEVTTLRVDVETDGRHAEVEFTRSFEEDAKRRDLTINAMSMDRHGKIYDYFDGTEDLRKGRIAFVGDAETRIKEDYLRILRFYRFMGRFGNLDRYMEMNHKVLMSSEEIHDGLRKISGERIWMELKKIMTGGYARQIVHVMIETGILHVCLGLPTTYKNGSFQLNYTPYYFSQMNAAMEPFKRNPQEFEIVPAAMLASFYPLEVTEDNNPTYPLRHLGSVYDFVDCIIDRLKMSSLEQEAFRYAFSALVHTLELPKYSFNSLLRYALVESTYQKPVLVKMGTVIRAGIMRKMSGIIVDESEVFRMYNTMTNAKLPMVTGQDLIKLGAKPGPQLGILIRYFRLIMATSYDSSRNRYSLTVEDIMEAMTKTDLSEIYIENVVIINHEKQLDVDMKKVSDPVKTEYWLKQYETVRDFYQETVKHDSNLIDIECDLSEFPNSNVAIMLLWENKDAAMISKLTFGTPSASMF